MRVPSYDLDDLVKVKYCADSDETAGVEKGGIYRVIGADATGVRVMTTKGEFVYMLNGQVERWGE